MVSPQPPILLAQHWPTRARYLGMPTFITQVIHGQLHRYGFAKDKSCHEMSSYFTMCAEQAQSRCTEQVPSGKATLYAGEVILFCVLPLASILIEPL